MCFREAFYDTFAMLKDAAGKVVRDADVKDAIPPIGEDVNRAAPHDWQ